MRFKHQILPAVVLLAMAGNPNPATASPYDTEVLVQPQTVSTVIPWAEALSELPPGGYPAIVPPSIAAGPVHGALIEDTSESLVYTPGSSFWELGTDSFVVRVASLDPDVFVTVTLQASDFRAITVVDEDFEESQVDTIGTATIMQEAAMAGVYGLRTVAEGGVVNESAFIFEDDRRTPPGAEGNTEENKVRPPPDSGPAQGTANPIVVYTLDGDTGPAADLVLTSIGNDWEITARLYDGGSTDETTGFELDSAESELRLDWWNASEMQSGGLRLFVDGQLAGALLGYSNWAPGSASRRVGAILDSATMGTAAVDVDDVRWSRSVGPRAEFAPILRDGFEDGLGAWNTAAATYIETAPGAALIGLEGLKIEPVYGFATYLRDPSPAAETSVGVRMRLSVDDLTLPTGDSLEILALSGVNQGTGNDQARLVLHNTFAGFRIKAQARSGMGWSSTALAALPAGTSTIELRWQAADQGDDNGWVQQWVDGVPGARIGLANDGETIESIRLGAWSTTTGTANGLYVDAFESWAFVPTP